MRKKLIKKACYLPLKIWSYPYRVYLNHWIPFWVKLKDVQLGANCYFGGMPIIRVAPGSKILIGNNVQINSRSRLNSAGISHPTILATQCPDSQIEINDNAGISGASIVAATSIKIGMRVLIGAGACLWDTDFHPLDPNKRRDHQTKGAKKAPIIIEDDVFIGARAIILKGVRVGRGAVVGAGAVVSKSVDPGQIIAGNPGRVIGSTESI